MASIKTLADARTRLTILTTPPADLAAITAAELSAGIEASCKVAKNGTRFSPTASDTMSDPAFCDEGNAQTLGPSNYEASLAPFLYLDDTTGAYVALDNAVYEAAGVKGAELVYVLRRGPKYDEPWAAGDRYKAYVAVSDNPQEPTETGGYIKENIPLLVQRAELEGVVAAAGV
jgi:hypothetical protein